MAGHLPVVSPMAWASLWQDGWVPRASECSRRTKGKCVGVLRPPWKSHSITSPLLTEAVTKVFSGLRGGNMDPPLDGRSADIVGRAYRVGYSEVAIFGK